MPTELPTLDLSMKVVLDNMVPGQPIGVAALEKKLDMSMKTVRRYMYVLIDAGWVTYEPPGKLSDKTKFTRAKERRIVPQQRVRRASKAALDVEKKSFLQLCREYEKAKLEVERLKKLIQRHVGD